MSLVWHMVCKDLRRLQLPLILWLALVLAHTALILTAGGKVEDPVSPAGFEGLRYFANTWGVIVSAVGFVLAAWLVMEDSLVVTSAFWPTRPISNARLLAAKAFGALLMFSLGPVLVLTPVWLGCGFSLHELALAAWHQAVMQALLSVAAFALAGVTATSGQFLVRAAGAAVLVPLGVAFALGHILPADQAISAGLVESRTSLVLGLLVLTPLAVIAHQYLTRRTWRSWAIAGVGFGLMLAVRFVWAWDFNSPEAPQGGGDVTELRDVAMTDLHAGFYGHPDHNRFSLQGELTGAPAQSYFRVNASLGEWTTGSDRFVLHRRLRTAGGSGGPPESLARQIAGVPTSDPIPRHWRIETNEPAEWMERARSERRQLEVALNLTLMQGRVFGELPLRVGAELKSGASRTRISRIERTEAGMVVRLEDRAAQPDPVYASFAGELRPRLRRAEDVFILVHRPTGSDQMATIDEIGAVQINSILGGQRELTLIPPTREVNGQPAEIPGWEDDAVLVQIRFEPRLTFTRPVSVEPFAAAPPL